MASKKSSSKGAAPVALKAVSDSMEFRKTNEAIGLKVSEGRLTLLSKKLFNTLIANAQWAGEPGANAPMDSPTAKKFFWLPLSDVIRDIAYDSHDTELIKQHLLELQKVRVEIEDGKQWASERLLSSVKIYNPAGLRSRGGQVWLGFVFPPEVFEHVMRPESYTKLSLDRVRRSGVNRCQA